MDQREFARRIYQGLGRPLLHLRVHDPSPYTPALLHACRKNPVYDRQCIGSRADYLREILLLTGLWPDFRRPLLDALADPTEDDDIDQLCDFALLYAQEGDAEARHLLYEYWDSQAEPDGCSGACQIVELDGLAGFLHVADRLGQAALCDPDLFVSRALLRVLEDSGGLASPDTLREAAGERYPYVRHYLDAVERDQQRFAQRRTKLLATWPYAKLREYIEQSGGNVSVLQLERWCENASEEDLRAAAADLLRQNEPQLLRIYLAIFEERAFPLGLEPLLPLVWGGHERVSVRAINAVAMLAQPEARDLAFQLMEAGHHAGHAVGILAQHYRPGDERALADLLARTSDKDELHFISGSLSDVFERHPSPAAAALFVDLYERGPCSLCRTRFVERLIEIGALPDWMREEARYDSDPDTRALVG